MKRKEFIVSSALGTVALGTGQMALAEAFPRSGDQARTRKILIAGGGFDHGLHSLYGIPHGQGTTKALLPPHRLGGLRYG